MLRLIWPRTTGLLTIAKISINGTVAKVARVNGMLKVSRTAR